MSTYSFSFYVYRNILEKPHQVAVMHKENGKYKKITYQKFGEQIGAVYKYLIDNGVKKGDRVAILGENSLFWTITDMAVISLGAISVAIYPTLTPEDTKYILNNSDSKILFLQDDTQLKKIISFKKDIKTLKKIVIFNDETLEYSKLNPDLFKDIINKGVGIENFKTQIEKISRDDIMCIIYTSGTTGPPKGVVLTHGNILSVIEAILKLFPDIHDLIKLNVSFLPLSHALERITGCFVTYYLGTTLAFAESLETVVDNMKELGPTHAVAVPRIFEKIYERITAGVSEKGGLLEKIFWWSVKNGKKVSERRVENRGLGFFLRIKYFISYRIIFSKLKDALGGNLKCFISGGAPLSVNIAEFFHAADILILEGYGATETSAPATWNQPENFKFGSVGLPIDGVDIKIADDGEVLIKGPGVFKEYWKMKKETDEVKALDGWYRSGDLGQIDHDGFLYITGRKKELIITAAGKNISPANIENQMKTGSKYISNIMAFGDRKKYITALVTLDKDNLASAVNFSNLDNISEIPEVVRLIENEILRINKNLARFEQIKKFKIIEKDFSSEDGLLTPSLKLKRNNIIKKYSERIEEMYEE